MRYLFAPLMLLASIAVGLMGYFSGSMKCEGCDATPSYWWEDADAPEWGNMILYSGGIVISTLFFLGAVIARARGLAVGVLLFQGLLTVALYRLVESRPGTDGWEPFLLAPLVLGAATLWGLHRDLRRVSAP